MSNLPLVIVYGEKSPLYSGLLTYLAKKEHRVLGMKNSHELEGLQEVPEYIFDLIGEAWRFEGFLKTGSRLCVVALDKHDYIRQLEGDWRVVVGHDVYGGFLQEEGSYLFLLFLQCVLNKTLPVAEETRILYETDFYEAVLRYMFFSGTGGNIYQVVGNEITGELMAKTLWEVGKMTTRKMERVTHMDVEESVVELAETQMKKIRWKPKVEFIEVAEVAIAPYFEKLDVILRSVKNPKKVVVEKVESARMREVVEEVEVFKEPVVVAEIPVVIEKEQASDFEIQQKGVWQELMNTKKIEPVPEIAVEVKVKEKPVKEAVNRMPRFNSRPKWLGKVILAGVTLVLLVMVGVATWLYMGFSAIEYDLRQFSTRVSEGKWDVILDRNEQNIAFLRSSEGVTYLLPGTTREGVMELFRLAEEGMYLQGQLKNVFETGKKVSAGVWGETDVDWKTVIPAWQDSLVSADTGLARLEARLSGNLLWVPKPWFEQVKKFKTEVSNWRNLVHQGVDALPVMSDFLGMDGRRRTYLVLLQNESELRPTGGFIGSYGVLNFEGGKFINFRVSDVYAADGQIKGYVEPPVPIRDVLGEASWKLRDANWQPYFVASSKDIRWFYEKATGERVDGVVGLTLATVEQVLGVVGGVKVSDYGVTVTKENLYEQAQFYAEKNFFPGSTQKQSFLGAVSSALFEELRTAKGEKQGKLLEALVESLNNRDTQIALNSQDSARVLAKLGWDGSLYGGVCPLENCYADYFFPVEANLGVNKANYFMYRNIDMQTSLKNNTVSRDVTISYENSATNSNWPAGDYKNYIRFYLPKDVSISEVYITDPKNPGNKLVYDFSKITVKSYAGKKEVGLLMEVPVLQKRDLHIVYSSNVTMDIENRFSYLLYAQRQSGLGKRTNFSFNLATSGSWSIGQVHPEAQLDDKGLSYKANFLKDVAVGVELLP